MTEQLLGVARAEEDAQCHMREVEKIKKDHHLTETCTAEELRGHKSQKYKFQQKDSATRVCSRCECSHPPHQCPAFGKTCNKCKKVGHFSDVCRTKDTDTTKPSEKPGKKFVRKHKEKKFHEGEAESSGDDFSEYESDEVVVEEARSQKKTHFPRKRLKHHKSVTFDDNEDPDTHYGIVQVL